ncbi:MAG: O-antigen ligase family protein [Elusimicrobiota bacterium]|nr:MAG: O-antigen ligase family protein [Elusimicrobiota bacterium]
MTARRALSLSLSALAFALPLSIAGANAALAAATACLLAALAGPDRAAASKALAAAARTPAFLALAACAAWALVSCAAGLDPAQSLKLWPRDLHKLWAFLAIASALALVEEPVLGAPLGVGLGLHAAVGVWQWVRAWATGGELRAHGFLHPVSYGEVLALGLIGAAAWLSRAPASASARRRRAAAGLLALVAAALVAAQTRAAILALLPAFAAACVLEPRWRRHALAALLLIGGAFAVWEASLPRGGRTLRTLFSRDAETSSHRSRFVLWGVALDAARERPLTGVGPGGYKDAFRRHHPGKLDGQDTWGSAHNLYLHQLAERGVPGLLLLLACLGAFALGALRAARERRDAWGLWAVAATAAFLVMNLTEVAWQTEQVATFFILVWLVGAGDRSAPEIL